jgi:hypothetical protein
MAASRRSVLMKFKVEIEGDSKEAVALALLQMVLQAEGRLDAEGALTGVDRDWVLDAYAECRMAVDGARPFEMDEDDEDEDADDMDGDEEQEDEQGADTQLPPR